MILPGQPIIGALNTTTYTPRCKLLCQSSIYALYITTLHIYIYRRQMYPTWSIDHRCLEYHYAHC